MERNARGANRPPSFCLCPHWLSLAAAVQGTRDGPAALEDRWALDRFDRRRKDREHISMDALCAESERERARLQQPPNSHHEARVPRKACASAEEGEDEWVSLDLRCALTFELITDPAKGSSCTHDACCNFGALRDYALASRRCPLENCGMAIKGPRDVRRDQKLRALLEHAPAEATTMWFKRSELCSWEAHPAAALVETTSALVSLAEAAELAASASSDEQSLATRTHATPPDPMVAGSQPCDQAQAEPAKRKGEARRAKPRPAAGKRQRVGGLTWHNVVTLQAGPRAPAAELVGAPCPASTCLPLASTGLEARPVKGGPTSATAAIVATPAPLPGLTWR